MSIKQALISVSDKTGVIDLARALRRSGITILSTGGTARLLQQENIPVTEISDYTGFPEMLDGRVKTLHPKVHAGILARNDLPEHVATMKKAGIADIELVIVNLYPFTQTIAKPDCNLKRPLKISISAVRRWSVPLPKTIKSNGNYRPGRLSAVIE